MYIYLYKYLSVKEGRVVFLGHIEARVRRCKSHVRAGILSPLDGSLAHTKYKFTNCGDTRLELRPCSRRNREIRRGLNDIFTEVDLPWFYHGSGLSRYYRGIWQLPYLGLTAVNRPR